MSRLKDTRPRRNMMISISDESIARLEVLKAKTEAASYTEVIRNALRLCEVLVLEHEAGKQFLSRDQDGTVTIYKMFF